MIKMISAILIGILLGISFILLYSLSAEANGLQLQHKMIERAKYYNKLHVKWSRKLNRNDIATDEQIYDRINSLMYWTDKYYDNSYGYSETDILLTLYSMIELESGWVNYESLDRGRSFGIGSMRWKTAKIVADMLGEEYNQYKLSRNTHKQIQYIVYWFYYLLSRDKNIDKAIVSYNQGRSYGEQRIEEYYFKVKGRKEYFEEVFF